MNQNDTHVPVLLDKALEYLNIKPDGIYVDCTLGRGGHTKAIVQRLETGKIYCFDQDATSIAANRDLFLLYPHKIVLIQANFSQLQSSLKQYFVNNVDGILYDIGVSSPQIDEAIRGFSYQAEGPLDMRMNQNQTLTAAKIVNEYSYQELKQILRDYGEENFAGQIARKIITVRQKQLITTTQQLVSIIKSTIPAKIQNKKHHPAKKTFQAIRIAVNNELNHLESSLVQALAILKPLGRIVAISFHSLEDRIIKNCFLQATSDPDAAIYAKLPIAKQWHSPFQIITKKPITPSQHEITINPRARSAKMRVIMKNQT